MTLGVPHHDTQQTRGGDVLHTSGEEAASQGALPTWPGPQAQATQRPARALTLQPPLAPQLQLLLLGQNSLGLSTWGQRTRGERASFPEDKAQSPRMGPGRSGAGP